MPNYVEILRLHEAGFSLRQIAKLVSFGRNKVTRTVKIAQEKELSYEEIAQWSREKLEKNDAGGSVINASTVAGFAGHSGHPLYGASKSAVRQMTKDAAAEYASKKIRVNSIHPGYITTDMADYASEVTQSSKEELDSTYPLGRMGEVEEVANMVTFLASDESTFTTASEFMIDGGAVNING